MTSLQYILQTTVFKKEKEVLEICCVFPSVTFKIKCTQAAKSGSGTRRWKQHRRQNQQKKSNFLVAASTWRVIKRCQSYYLGVRRSIGVFSFSVQISANSNTERDGWDGRMIGTIVRCCDFSLQDRRITWISRGQEKTVLFRHRRNFSLPLHKKKHLKQPEFSQTASTESGGVTSLCLPSAPRLSRWINPPTQRCHLSSFCSQVAPIETLPRRGRCVCSSPKALSQQTRRRSQQLVVKAPTSRCLLCVQRLFSILTA